MQVQKYTPDMKSAWNALIDSITAPVLFYRDFMEYHSDRFADYSLVALDGDELLAVLPANVCDDTLWTHQGLTFGGWQTSAGIGSEQIAEIFDQTAAALKADGIASMVYKATPSIYRPHHGEEDAYELFRRGGELFRRDLSTALRPSSRNPVGSQRKRNFKNAAKAGVTVEETPDYASFHALLSEVLVRHDTKPVHSLDELLLLFSRFPGRIRLFCGFLNDEMVAGTLIFDNGRVAHTQYLASSEVGRRVGALDYVLERLITGEFADREFFSFGISTEDGGKVVNHGLLSQKEGFGGFSFPQDFYRLAL